MLLKDSCCIRGKRKNKKESGGKKKEQGCSPAQQMPGNRKPTREIIGARVPSSLACTAPRENTSRSYFHVSFSAGISHLGYHHVSMTCGVPSKHYLDLALRLTFSSFIQLFILIYSLSLKLQSIEPSLLSLSQPSREQSHSVIFEQIRHHLQTKNWRISDDLNRITY